MGWKTPGMRKTIILFLIFNLLGLEYLNAQRKKNRFLDRCETIYGIGVTNFLGELGGSDGYGTNGLKDLEFSFTRPTVHLGFRYRKSPTISYKFNYTQGWVAGRDSFTRETYRRNRNLSFKSPIIETSFQVEVSLLQLKSTRSRYKLQGVRGKSGIDMNLYLFGGVGGFFFNPHANYSGKWVALQPIGTEGQGIAASRKKYSRVQACFPIGFGFRFPLLNKNWTMGFEYGMRITTTDYIDDVSSTYYSPTLVSDKYGYVAAKLSNRSLIPSEVPTSAVTGQQRGDPTDKDSYMFGIITASYRLKSGKSVLPKFR